MSETGVVPDRLTFEITETAAVRHITDARRFSERLAQLGCRLAPDDFNAGFGSFYYIKHLPFDFLKIDGEFVRYCTTSRTDQLVIEAVSGSRADATDALFRDAKRTRGRQVTDIRSTSFNDGSPQWGIVSKAVSEDRCAVRTPSRVPGLSQRFCRRRPVDDLERHVVIAVGGEHDGRRRVR